MSKGFTISLGLAELAGSLGVILGILAQPAAIGLILIMLGAIQKKIFVWRTSFWGKSGTDGWSYDTMLIVMNLTILTGGGGSLSLGKYLGLAVPLNRFASQASTDKKSFTPGAVACR